MSSTYQIGNALFVALRAMLDSVEIDPSQCKLIIEFPHPAMRSNFVEKLRRDAPPIGEFTGVSGAQAGNFGGKWQGVAYDFTLAKADKP